MIEVEVPGVGTVEFPDGMSPEAMGDSINRRWFPEKLAGKLSKPLFADVQAVPSTKFTQPPMPEMPAPSMEMPARPKRLAAPEAPTVGEALGALARGPQFPRIPIPATDTPTAATLKQLGNVAIGFGEFAASPLGIATAQLGPIFPNLVKGVIAGTMAKEVGQQAGNLVENFNRMTPAEQSKAIVDLTATGEFMAAPLIGSVGRSRPTIIPPEPLVREPSQIVAPAEVRQVEQAAAPLLPQAAAEEAKIGAEPPERAIELAKVPEVPPETVGLAPVKRVEPMPPAEEAKSVPEAEKPAAPTAPTKEGYAPTERQIEEDIQRERERVNALGLPPEAGVGNRVQPAAEVQPLPQAQAPPEPGQGVVRLAKPDFIADKTHPIDSRSWRMANLVGPDWKVTPLENGAWVAESQVEKVGDNWGKLVRTADEKGNGREMFVKSAKPTPVQKLPPPPPAEKPEYTPEQLERQWMEPAIGKYQYLGNKDIQIIVTQDAANPDMIRATYLKKGEPTGHQLFRNLSDLKQATSNSVKVPNDWTGAVQELPISDAITIGKAFGLTEAQVRASHEFFTKKATAEKPATAKEAWQKSQEQFVQENWHGGAAGGPRFTATKLKRLKSEHKTAVAQALRESKPVPPEVLADYPELKPAAKTETVQAAAKAETEIQSVAKTEGQRSAKEVKTELLARIEDAMKGAPEESAWSKSEHGFVEINIPGDGNFTISRNLKALGEVRKRVERLQTSAGTESIRVKVPREEWSTDIIARDAVRVYGNERNAIAALERQLSNPEFLKDAGYDAKQIGAFERAVEILREGLPENILAAKISELERELESKNTAIKIGEERLRVLRQKEGKRLSAKDRRFAEDQEYQISRAKREIPEIEKSLSQARKELEKFEPPPDITAKPESPEKGPGIVGLGAAIPAEFEGGAAGADIYGIAYRVRQARALAGQTAAFGRGQGVSDIEAIRHGRQLLAQNPKAADEAADLFAKTEAVSYDGLAVLRARGEEAFQAARRIESKFGTESPEYVNAFEAAVRWDQISKEMQTSWHRQGMAQQGSTDIDTGDFTSLHREFTRMTGESFTPKQAKQAKKIADTVRQTQTDTEKATKKLFDELEKAIPSKETPTLNVADARKKLASLSSGAKPNFDQIKTIWNYVKSVYIASGESNLDVVGQKAADDLGISKRDVMNALASPKGARALTDEAFMRMQRQRQAIISAKNWLLNASMPGWQRFLSRVPRYFFMAKVFGHGTVGMVTHAGNMMFDPAAIRTYWPEFFRQYKLMFSEKYHARMMQYLMDDPYFVTARRAGLANDPFRYQDDYQNPKLTSWVGKWALAGNRGFDSLKLIRQARWNQLWDQLPDEIKTKEMAKLLADQVNHATGIVRSDVLGRFAGPAGTIFFAPKLEMSRWAFVIGDPIKAGKIFSNWKNATPEERIFAMAEFKQKARVAGMYLGLLALNQAVLSASGSKQEVNFTNPHRGDFLAFKAFGQNISVISPMLHMVGLFADLYRIATAKRKGVEALTSRRAAMGQAAWAYGQGKLSPFSQPIADLITQATFEGRPMPFSADRVPAWLRKRGITKWTWPHYLAETYTPIPVSEALREVWESQGMNRSQIETYTKAVAAFTVMGGTGIRLSEDIHQK